MPLEKKLCSIKKCFPDASSPSVFVFMHLNFILYLRQNHILCLLVSGVRAAKTTRALSSVHVGLPPNGHDLGFKIT